MKIYSSCTFLIYAFAVALPLVAQAPPVVPTVYQATYNNMATQIGVFQATLNKSWNGKPSGVNWAPHLSSAESDNYLALLGADYYNQAVLTELLELEATGAKSVTVHINFPILYQPFYTYTGAPGNFQKFVAFYQQMASDIHARGMKLVVEATVNEALDGTEGAAYAPYYATLDWTDYMNARAQNAVNIAEIVKPDYLSLICEPDSEANNAGQPTENSPSGAMQLLQTILGAFEQAKVTGVTIGAGAGTWIAGYTSYIQEFSTTSLNYIDTHVYPVNNNFLPNILTAATLIHQAGKAMAMSEVWANKEANGELGVLNINTVDSRDVFSFWAPIDTAFLQAMVDCAQYQDFVFLSPAYPEYFAAYLDYSVYGADAPTQLLPAAFAAAASANRAGAFTSTGVAFSTMISGVDKTPPGTPAAPTASSISGTGVTITWLPTTDNVGVAGYKIFRGGAVVSELAMSPFHDTPLTPGATYSYNLSAVDVQGNVSAQSPPLSVTILILSAPSVPQDLKLTSETANSLSFSWSPSTGGGGVGGYRVLRGVSPTSMTVIDGFDLVTRYTYQAQSPKVSYFAVESYNLQGMSSAPSAILEVAGP